MIGKLSFINTQEKVFHPCFSSKLGLFPLEGIQMATAVISAEQDLKAHA